MVTERIQVVVSERGAVTVRGNIDGIGISAERSAQQVRNFNTSLDRSGVTATATRSRVGSATGALAGMGVTATRTARGGVSFINSGLTAVGRTTRRVGVSVGAFGQRLQNLGGTARGTTGGIDGLRGALAALGIVFGVQGIARLSDEYTNLRNRLRLVTDSTADLNRVQEQLVQISNETRVELSTTAILYQRTASAVENLGINTQRVSGFVRSLNQATLLSGASAQEATNAIRQLTQGLASNQLRGEEFRSVAEQLPFVLAVVAQATNRTAGELRELAFSGGLTARVLIESFEASQESIAALFANLDVTIGQSLAVLQTSLLTFIGRSNEAFSVSSLLASGILFVATNIDVFAISVGALASVIAVRFVAGAVVSAVSGIGQLIVATQTGILATRSFTLAVFGLIGALRVNIASLIAARTAILLNIALAWATASQAVVRFVTVAIPGLIRGLLVATTTSAGFGRAVLGVRTAITALSAAILRNPIFAGILVATFGATTTAVALFGDRIREVISTVTNFTTELLGLNTTSSSSAEELARLTEEFARLASSANVATGSIQGTAAAQRALQAAAAGGTGGLGAAGAAAGAGGRGGSGGGGGPRVVVQRQSPELALQNDFLRVFGSIPAAFRSGDLSVEEARALFNRQLQRRIRMQERAGRLDRSRIRFGGRGAPSRVTPGFQRGGSITVGGRGGIDRNTLSINGRDVARVTRGENINITPADQNPGNTTQINFTVVADDADSFRRSESQINTRLLNVLDRAERNR